MPESTATRARIKVMVSRGMFSNERGVRINLPNGEVLSMLVDRMQVNVDRDPQRDDEVGGWLEVLIVSTHDGRVIIELPQQTFTTGTRVEVPHELLKTAA